MESFVGRSIDIVAMSEQRKKRMIFIATALGCVLVGCLLVYGIYHWYVNREYSSYKVVNTVSVKNGKSQKYAAYQGGVIYYGRDGVTAIDGDGDTLWGGSYEMAEPALSTCEESAVVADIGGTSLYVYKGGDTGTEFKVDYPIVQATISEQGLVAVLMEEASSNTIALYNPFDKKSQLLAEIPTNVEDGYPVSMDISRDGASIVASYLCVTTGAAQSRVAFYNFSEVGKNTNGMVGAHNYNDVLISQVEFVDEDVVCLFGEKGFYLWENMKQPELARKREFGEEIESAFVGDGYVGAVIKEESGQYTLKGYDSQGEEILSVEADGNLLQAEMTEEEVILFGDGAGDIYRLNGVRKFHGKFSGGISYLFPGKKRNRYVLIQNSKIKYIKLK